MGGYLRIFLPVFAAFRSATIRRLSDAPLVTSAISQAELIRSGAVSSEELTRAHLDRIDAVNGDLNAVVTCCPDLALDAARRLDADQARGLRRGPLHGVPVTIKDSFDVAQVRSTGGTMGRTNHVPTVDATAVARLRQAGCVILGKTNTPELTLSFITDNLLFGPTHNPYDLTRSPGGSSGGAAAVVAACGSALDIGSDLGGSVRVPAHYCGVVGIKPTPGRVPRTGHIFGAGGHLDRFGTIGPIARTVADVALALDLLCGPDGVDPSIVPLSLEDSRDVVKYELRVAVFEQSLAGTTQPAVIEAVRAAADALRAVKVTVVEDRPALLAEAWVLVVLAMEADLGGTFRRLLSSAGTQQPSRALSGYVGPPNTSGLQYARYLLATSARAAARRSPFLARIAAAPLDAPLSVADFTELLAEIDRVRAGLLGFMTDYDAILGPVSCGAAPLTSEAEQAQYSEVGAHNLSGFPAVVVRAGTAPGGLPVGVQIAARPWQDHVALALAGVIERATGGWRRPPDSP